jgi:hypothetical protein
MNDKAVSATLVRQSRNEVRPVKIRAVALGLFVEHGFFQFLHGVLDMIEISIKLSC